jgi:hypothetical protein
MLVAREGNNLWYEVKSKLRQGKARQKGERLKLNYYGTFEITQLTQQLTDLSNYLQLQWMGLIGGG